MIIYGIAVKLAVGLLKGVWYARVYMYTFVVTNMDSLPEYLIKFYYKRGLMENFIGVLCHFMLQ